MLFLFSMMIGSLISISASTWMGMWIGLEINLLSIIPLMNNKNNIFSSEASMKYFITQAMASTILLFSIIIMSKNFNLIWNNNMYLIIFNSSLLTKMGAAPFHFWFPEVVEGLSWMNCYIIFTWQKIAPMIIFMYSTLFPNFLFMIIVLSMLIGGIMGFNQISLRKILAYSSINHIGWMISSMFFMENIWMLYFSIYSLISINIIFILKIFNIFYIKQLISNLNNNFMMKLIFILNFMSLGGLPPFIGFLPKWLAIQSLITHNFMFLAFLMVITTLLTLYYYIRLTFPTLMLNSNEINFSSQNQNNNFFMSMNMMMTLMLIISTLLFNFL
uniref:NADH-ubiquinone oxidoreductase chain 2 n=1 Tax=Staphylinidae sp. BMNH 1274643 TaxID=1796584 RepID=A0A126TFW4_9COLE|nr:NADH dehydrogenase subunit 2 [Staphylinidae sp. BMNH 1274643]